MKLATPVLLLAIFSSSDTAGSDVVSLIRCEYMLHVTPALTASLRTNYLLCITHEIVSGKHENVGGCVIVKQCFRRHLAFLYRCIRDNNSRAKTNDKQENANVSCLHFTSFVSHCIRVGEHLTHQ